VFSTFPDDYENLIDAFEDVPKQAVSKELKKNPGWMRSA
jgi:hypothetical protein